MISITITATNNDTLVEALKTIGSNFDEFKNEPAFTMVQPRGSALVHIDTEDEDTDEDAREEFIGPGPTLLNDIFETIFGPAEATFTEPVKMTGMDLAQLPADEIATANGNATTLPYFPPVTEDVEDTGYTLRNETDYPFLAVEEEYREYDYVRDGSVLTITVSDVVAFHEDHANQRHILVCGDDDTIHVMPMDFVALTIKVKDGTPHFHTKEA